VCPLPSGLGLLAPQAILSPGTISKHYEDSIAQIVKLSAVRWCNNDCCVPSLTVTLNYYYLFRIRFDRGALDAYFTYYIKILH